MILDGKSSETKKYLKQNNYDICIVGAGAVGFAMAHRLYDVTTLIPKRVIVLESGVKNDHEKEPDQDPWKARRWCDSIVGELDTGTTNSFVREARSEFLTRSRTRCYGGSTNCWGGYIRPLDDYDFDPKFWPIKKQDLYSHYIDALHLLGLSNFENFDKPENWQTLVDNVEHPIEILNKEAMAAEGLKTVIIQQQQALRILDFQEYLGWIFEGDKTNLTLVRNATALYFNKPETVFPRHVQYLLCGAVDNKEIQEFTVSASKYVLAMGGLEVPRFLLINREKNLGYFNNGNIGKFYMNHPKYEVCAKAELENIHVGPNLRNFYEDGVPLKDRPLVRIYPYIVPTEDALKNQDYPLMNFRATFNWHQWEPPKIWVELNFEQRRNADSTVSLSLDPKHIDMFGLRQLHVDWQFLPADRSTVTDSMLLIWNALKRIGSDSGKVTKFEFLRWNFDKAFPPSQDLDGRPIYTGDHHLGTCSMSKDGTGVVDEDCKLLSDSGVDNLWICSTAVFPTGGWANSTLTLLALALRLADKLQRLL